MLLADTILASLVTSGILMLIFKTTAIEEYASLFGLDSFLGIARWRAERGIPPTPTSASCKPAATLPRREPIQYMAWARARATTLPPGFIRWSAMLFTCPFCLGLWIAVGSSFVLIRPWSAAIVCIPAIYACAIAIFRRVF